jgi:Reverse transcriptase (RNA-dependent DNA polymerase)
MKNKSDLAEKVLGLIKQMKSNYKKTVKFIRLDDAGENKSLQQLCEQEDMGIQFEYTGPSTPQYNGRAERKFAILYGRVRTILNGARLPKTIRDGVWTEAAQYATEIENAIVTATKKVPANTKFYGPDKIEIHNLKIFGEIGVVENGANRKMRAKLEDRGRPCMYLGRAQNHSSDTFRFLNLSTNKIIISRNVVWLNKVYGEWKGLTSTNLTSVTHLELDNEETEDDEDYEMVQSPGRDGIENEMPRTPRTNNTKVQREMRKLGGCFFNPEATMYGENQHVIPTTTVEVDDTTATSELTPDTGTLLMDRRSLLPEFALLSMDYDQVPPTQYKDMFVAPQSFEEAWNHKCNWQRPRWQSAAIKEIDKMERLEVWQIVKRKTIPPDRKCIKYKWIFDVKRDGTFKARLVACGYSQVPGVDFQESYSPVVNDVAFRIMVIFQMVYKLDSLILDVEAAFLNGDLDEEIYMECPKGMQSKEDEVLLLRKALYGLVQSARQFFKKFTSILVSIGFVQSYAEPCLFIKKDETSIVLIAVHVDDCYIIGTTTALENTVENIKKSGLNVTVQKNTKDYLSCEIVFDEKMEKAWFGQPHLVKKLSKVFGPLVTGMPTYKTPGTPGFNIVRPKEGDAKVTPSEQAIYRSAVGSLLQFIKYSRPDIANSVRELAKCMDGATPAAFKEMKRIIKYVLDTQHFGLRMQPIFQEDNKWQMTVYTDSDWAGDKDNRHSVSGYAIFLLNVPILWKSRLQRTVALSSSEAEYYAISEAAKEIKFVYQILDSLGIKVTLPIIVNVDNVGAIFMTENVTATTRTRHVDARYHYVREFVSEGFLKIIFVKSADNKSDMFTKNVNAETLDFHINSYVIDKQDILQNG